VESHAAAAAAAAVENHAAAAAAALNAALNSLTLLHACYITIHHKFHAFSNTCSQQTRRGCGLEASKISTMLQRACRKALAVSPSTS
jgi:hypothetical protein